MKTSKLFYLSILILSAFLIFACDNGSNSNDEPINNTVQIPTATQPPSVPQTPQEPSQTTPTTSNYGSASEQESAVLDEMNYARTNPKGYVTERLQPLVSTYTGSKLSALNELIDEMNSMSAVPAYSWGDGLYKAAKEWVETQGPTGEFSHDTNWSGRIKKYCNCGAPAENLSAGYNNDKAVNIVIQLLVDANTPGRGHRKNILSSSYTHAGAAIGPHAGYGYMCCIDFANGYSEK